MCWGHKRRASKGDEKKEVKEKNRRKQEQYCEVGELTGM